MSRSFFSRRPRAAPVDENAANASAADASAAKNASAAKSVGAAANIGALEAPDPTRRRLLVGAAVTGVSVGSAAALVGEADGGGEKASAPNHRSPVYRETEHIRQAYRRMRF